MEAVVIGNGRNNNTLGLIRSLGEAGVKVNAILFSKNKNPWVSKSKYISKSYLIKFNKEEIINVLNIIAKNASDKIYVYSASDAFVSMIKEIKEKISNKYVLPSIKITNNDFEPLMNKQFVNDIAQKVGLTLPKTYYFNKENYNIEEMIDFFKDCFPLCVRSLIDGGTVIEKINNSDELKSYIEQYKNDILTCQEFIQKEEEIGITALGLDSGDVCVPGLVHKIRTNIKNSPGSTTYGILDKNIDIALKNKIIEFIKYIGYSGIFDIEFMIKDGKYYFVECNFRNGSYGYAFTKLGFNFPAMWMGLNIENNQNKDRLVIMNEMEDKKYISHHKMSLFKWLGYLMKTDVTLTWNKKDPMPFWFSF